MNSLASDLQPLLSTIKLVITDVDGVLTDGRLYYDANGECIKCFHVRDGMGMRLLEENGVKVAVVSGRDSAGLRRRIADLNITTFKLGVKDKFAACRELMIQTGIPAEHTACIGDDCIDLPAFKACSLSFAVADAPDYVKAAATGTLSLSGGAGAFREVADAILFAQGKGAVITSAEGYSTVMSKMSQ
ncbi:KdsC family phosphatase [Pseudomonas cremoricolorata]|uniref:3-deoxy-D-manno-octulosonate 8-phosphate phosphatase KdsC n=1 Tax=Pseudomonas cremoricolorata TaxID=157783 RepID=A0A089WST9_9PSED|nr:HAD-IIIA family hydrolase [Pseudomonas cremoricolorata]AIR91641.1 3-deoxy-D-manno-octulosonate 8-phosphate phosphatase [Pseudomonas cremoricolorata]